MVAYYCILKIVLEMGVSVQLQKTRILYLAKGFAPA